jgi:hypothetical protein
VTAPVIHMSGERPTFHCPGCGYAHQVDSTWAFNGSLILPTIRPSILACGAERCHSFVTNGEIQFLADSTHALAGQAVALPPWGGFDSSASGAGGGR